MARWGGVAAGALLVLAVAAAAAEGADGPPTVRDLRANCEIAVAAPGGAGPGWTPERGLRAVQCLSYLAGIGDMLGLNCLVWRSAAAAGDLPRADAAGAAPVLLARAFLAWAEAHPAEADEHQSLAGLALVEVFPCP